MCSLMSDSLGSGILSTSVDCDGCVCLLAAGVPHWAGYQPGRLDLGQRRKVNLSFPWTHHLNSWWIV